MSWNLWKRFEELLPKEPLLIGEVVSVDTSAKTVTVQLVGGGVIKVRGEGVNTGEKVFLRGGEVRGKAPSLPVVQIQI